MELHELTRHISQGQSMDADQARQAADALVSAEVAAGEKETFLTALARKGESVEEVYGLARRFRELARDPGLDEWRDRAIDVCGTGGDKVGSFNISTAVVFGLAAAGVPVFKHGNRSITSKCGSANLLEAIGVDLMADDATLRASMSELGFCFMFAPAFHPAFKEIMPVRQQLAAKGQRSVFNVLGPLLNPAKPAFQLLGVYAEDLGPLLAGTLGKLGLRSGMVAHCVLADGRGMDELSVAGQNRVVGFGDLEGSSQILEPEQLGLHPCPVQDLLGGDLRENLDILDRLLSGKAPRGLEDTYILNVAAGLKIVGLHADLKEGIAVARDLLHGGKIRKKVDQTKEFFTRK